MSSVLLLALIVSLALHVRLGLGHWPVAMVENYDSLLFDLHEWCILIVGMFAVYAAIPLWLLLIAIPSFRSRSRDHLLQFALIVLGWVLIGLFFFIDYRGFASWFLD